MSYAALGEAAENGIAAKSDAPDSHEDTEQLMAEIQRLPEAYRETILLYYYQDATYQDLADLLGVSVATINARLTKGRAMLRERMGVLKP